MKPDSSLLAEAGEEGSKPGLEGAKAGGAKTDSKPGPPKDEGTAAARQAREDDGAEPFVAITVPTEEPAEPALTLENEGSQGGAEWAPEGDEEGSAALKA